MNRHFRRLLWALGGILLLTLPIFPQRNPQQQEDTYLDPSLPEGLTVRDIISRFAAKEETYKQAREHYTYRQVVRMQTLNDNGFPDGEYDDTFDVTFNDQGERTVKEVSHPRDTLKRIRVTPEDIDDIRNRLPFVLTTDEIPEYNIKYRGQQDTAGTHCYVFDISPKAMAQDRRYFEGRIWVDANQYQIVKSSGKAVPDLYNQNGENLFPSFTTYRELVDGKYWFPSYTKSDDNLHFSTDTVHVIETVDYTNYKRFGAESRIIFNGQEVASDQPQGNTSQTRAPQNSAPPRSYPQQQQQASPQQEPAPQQQARVPRQQQQPPNPPAQPVPYVQQSLMSLEREISDAINAKEVSIMERILTDDYRLISANGDSEDKFALLDDIHNGRAGNFAQPENMQVQVNGDRAIVVGEREESIPVSKNKMQTARVRFTDTFIRRAGEWLLIQTKEGPAR
jgi:ketosteroid isomerase-like protein